MEGMTGLDWKSDAPPTVIRRFHEGTGKAPNGTGGVKLFFWRAASTPETKIGLRRDCPLRAAAISRIVSLR